MHCAGALPRWFDAHLFEKVISPVVGAERVTEFIERLPFRRFCRQNGNLGWAYDRQTRKRVYELFLTSNRRKDIADILRTYAGELDQRSDGIDFKNDPLISAGYFDLKGVYEIEAMHIRLMMEDEQLPSVEAVLKKFYLRNREISKNASLNRRTVKALEDLLRLGAIRNPDVITLLQMMRVMTDPWIDEDPQRAVILQNAKENKRLSSFARCLANMELGTDLGLQLGTVEAEDSGRLFDVAEELANGIKDEFLLGRIAQKRARRLLSTADFHTVPKILERARQAFLKHQENTKEDVSLSLLECDRLLCTYLKNARSDDNDFLEQAETIARDSLVKLNFLGAPYQRALFELLLSQIIQADMTKGIDSLRQEARELVVSALEVFDASSSGRDYANALLALTFLDIAAHEASSDGKLMNPISADDLKLRILECEQIYTAKRSVNGRNNYYFTIALIDLLSGRYAEARSQFHDLLNEFKNVSDGLGVRHTLLRLLELELRSDSKKEVILALLNEIEALHAEAQTLMVMDSRLQALRKFDKNRYLDG